MTIAGDSPMNMIDSFNKTISYIEATLEDEIEEKTILRLSGYSYAMFSRIFSILTETTLAEYIRSRKLTKAAFALRESKEKVIDIALQYGYDSPDSFSAAFKNFHGSTPSEVRKGKPFKVVSLIQLSLSITGGKNMDISIQKKPAFTVAGIKLNAIDTSLCNSAWDKLYSLSPHEALARLGNGQSYGMCFDIKDCNSINYMACYDVTDREAAERAGLEIVEIPENEYAVAKLKGPVPECIHQGWKYLMEVFFPEQGYMHSGAPDFEVYGDGDIQAKDYEMALWVPVTKESKP